MLYKGNFQNMHTFILNIENAILFFKYVIEKCPAPRLQFFEPRIP